LDCVFENNQGGGNVKKILLLALGAIAMSGCATSPERIAAAPVANDKYMTSDCTQLATTMAEATASLNTFSEKQATRVKADAASVFLVLIPASWFTGDNAADVAKYKGEVEAIKFVQAKKGCNALRA
jgi:hypothetical protein